VALAFVLLVPLASWIDSHREAGGRARSPGSK
jgi:hypothetical protein